MESLQLPDFCLAKWASTSVLHVACDDTGDKIRTKIVVYFHSGIDRYLAPEYFMYGNVDDKVDVYAFGVVLLKLLSGRKPISNEYPKGQESLVMWDREIDGLNEQLEEDAKALNICSFNSYKTEQAF
ncbi:hypothetical protein Sjap_003122 [Stephania japonica]|uniref:Protein kinase domain-containing protein n=1 Tax=Stephania japonica TaxID=461633 RepID=A0AAP0KQA3_9MAGN